MLDIKDMHGCWSRWQSGICICTVCEYNEGALPFGEGYTMWNPPMACGTWMEIMS